MSGKQKIDLEKVSHIHFIGVGGIGMSALARHFLAEKKQVSGSDRVHSPLIKALGEEGVRVCDEQVAENITKNIDLVVYTEAMSSDHPEMKAAKKRKVPMVNYFTALGLAMNPYYLIAVAGTHGKTTTTAMITDIFEVAEKDPTAVIGSLRAKTKRNYRYGKSKYAIVEACEYKRDFLHLTPDVLVITNIEFEHVDYYKDLADVQAAFRTLAEQVHETGVVIADVKHPNVAPVVEGLQVPVVDYQEFLDMSLSLKQPGLHNRQNAAAALATAKHEKLTMETAKQALEQFAGTWRRFEYKGECNGAPIYDDYAHHPTEIKATLAGVRELYPDRRIIVAFQPHTYTRTKSLFDEFAKSFAQADAVLFLPIYAAREKNTSGVTSRELAVRALEFTGDAQFVETFEAAGQLLRQSLTAHDVLVVMGAGDVSILAQQLTV